MLGRTKSHSGDEELLLALTPTHTHTQSLGLTHTLIKRQRSLFLGGAKRN